MRGDVMGEEHLPQWNIIVMSATISAYVVGMWYLFFVYIPKKAVAEKKIVNQLFDFIRETIKGLKELKPAYEEILVQRGQKLKYKGLKVALMPGCIDKSIAMYEELLRKPAGYYAGKHLLTISRIYQLKVVAGDARNELDTLQQLLEDIRES